MNVNWKLFNVIVLGLGKLKMGSAENVYNELTIFEYFRRQLPVFLGKKTDLIFRIQFVAHSFLCCIIKRKVCNRCNQKWNSKWNSEPRNVFDRSVSTWFSTWKFQVKIENPSGKKPQRYRFTYWWWLYFSCITIRSLCCCESLCSSNRRGYWSQAGAGKLLLSIKFSFMFHKLCMDLSILVLFFADFFAICSHVSATFSSYGFWTSWLTCIM